MLVWGLTSRSVSFRHEPLPGGVRQPPRAAPVAVHLCERIASLRVDRITVTAPLRSLLACSLRAVCCGGIQHASVT